MKVRASLSSDSLTRMRALPGPVERAAECHAVTTVPSRATPLRRLVTI